MSIGRFFQSLFPVFNNPRPRKIFTANPVAPPKKHSENIHIQIYKYNRQSIEIIHLNNEPEKIISYIDDHHICWVNIDGSNPAFIEKLSNDFNIHPLIAEDINSSGQRPKLDESENIIFCLINMLFYNPKINVIEPEQVSIVLGKNFVLSIQEEGARVVFNSIREKLKIQGRLRNSSADHLCYALIDTIVDHYYIVLEQLGETIENLEDQIIRTGNNYTLARLNALRKELIILKRNISPVRDLVNSILRSDNELLQEKTINYFKDVYDHITQAFELVENYRDMMMNLHDLYISKVNLRMNEVMKVMAIVTCLLAPATVIGGIFGMNFDRVPWLHNRYGFYIAVALMFAIPVYMIWIFKKRKWF